MRSGVESLPGCVSTLRLTHTQLTGVCVKCDESVTERPVTTWSAAVDFSHSLLQINTLNTPHTHIHTHTCTIIYTLAFTLHQAICLSLSLTTQTHRHTHTHKHTPR